MSAHPAVEALGIEGPVIDIAITPDRADCFSIRGIARDLAAAGVGVLRDRPIKPVPSVGPAGPVIEMAFPPGEEKACPMFAGRVVRGVRNGPSPRWMQERLRAIGLRPISALVDITNYVMMDLGRPLHVFDLAALEGDLTLRFARAGEKLAALDDKTYELEDGMTVIADARAPHALGGIMGGEESGCGETTTDVLLEVALFDPVRTAMTGRKLGIDSDARARFERGLDGQFVVDGMEHGTRLIMELCGGEPGEPVIVGAPPPFGKPIEFAASELGRLAGITLQPEEIETYLGKLGFEISGGPERWVLRAPSWRHDISTQACIVEELARLLGYEHIPPMPVTRVGAVGTTVLTAEQSRRSRVRRAAAATGSSECVSWSFVPEVHARAFGAKKPISLVNPIASELSVLRPSLLPSLLAAAARNTARKRAHGALFELAPRYFGERPGDQVQAIAGIRYGDAVGREWTAQRRPADVFDAKADALDVLAAAGIRTDALQCRAEAPSWYHPGRSGVLALGPNVVAAFGELHPKIVGELNLDVHVVAYEIDLDTLPKAKAKKAKRGKARPPLDRWPYPAVERDFAFVVDRGVTAERLLRAVRSAEKKLVRDVELFDVYEGERVEAGKRSIAVSVRLQSKSRTLTEVEVEPIAQKIVAAAEKQCGASLR